MHLLARLVELGLAFFGVLQGLAQLVRVQRPDDVVQQNVLHAGRSPGDRADPDRTTAKPTETLQQVVDRAVRRTRHQHPRVRVGLQVAPNAREQRRRLPAPGRAVDDQELLGVQILNFLRCPQLRGVQLVRVRRDRQRGLLLRVFSSALLLWSEK